MSIEVEAPDGSAHEFPDGTDQAVIKKAMADYVKSTKSKYAASQDDQRDGRRWDFAGDTAKAFKGSKEALKEDAAKAMPSASERKADTDENIEKYGTVLGGLKDAVYDKGLKPLGHALSVPLDALGMAASPAIGAANSLLGSGLSYLPAPATNGLPDHITKDEADRGIDQALSLAAPEGMGGGLAGVEAAAAARQSAATTKTANQNTLATAQNPAFAEARKAGYVVHPADAVAEPGPVANSLASVGGKVKTQQAASVKNQALTNQIAAKDLGLPADTQLDEGTFNAVRGKAANAYKTIENSAAKLPTGRVVADQSFLNDVADLDAKSADFAKDFPEAAAKRSEAVKAVQDSVFKQDFSPKAGVEMIRNLRDDARVNLKNWADGDKIRTGLAQRDAANAIEGLIERNLTAAGDPAAVAEYRAARQTIAKAHDVESVTDEKGNVDAKKLATLGNRRPLTGGLKTIADTASAFPKSMQNPTKFGGLEKHSVLEAGWTAANMGSAFTTAMLGHPLAAVGEVASAALPLMRPAARSLALSNSIQNRLLGLRSTRGVGPAMRQNAVPVMAGQNALRGAINPQPALGQGGQLPGGPPVTQPQPVAPPQVPTNSP